MKRIALSLLVVAASGAYVWSQAGGDALDPVLDGSDVVTGSVETNLPGSPIAQLSAPPAAAFPPSDAPPARFEWEWSEEGESAEDAVEPERGRSWTPPAEPAASVEESGTVAEASPLASVETVAVAQEAASPSAPPPMPVAPPTSLPPLEARLPRPRPVYHPPQMSEMVVPVAMTVASSARYADGAYAGPVVDAYYGLLQVQAVVQGGQLADVKILRYPSDRLTSVVINRRAMPKLRREAIQAQNAQVDFVSGATLTSAAFVRSLDVALRQAHA